MPLPIDMDIIAKRKEIPEKLAELSYKNEKKALEYMRLWGEKKKPISELHADLTKALN